MNRFFLFRWTKLAMWVKYLTIIVKTGEVNLTGFFYCTNLSIIYLGVHLHV